MIEIDWRNLRTLNGSQNNAFEELCCQLAQYEKPEDTSFVRKGTPDAGLECFATLYDGTEWGWQAKYFLSMGTSQWSQLDESVKTALEKHPNLVRYTVCLPLDFPDARIDGQTSMRDKWEDRVLKWRTWAADEGMQVQFEYWGSYQILERLTREEHRGRSLFWFGKEFFSRSWFEAQLEESIDVAGPRYTPEVHVDLPIAQLFDALARTSNFSDRVKHKLQDIKKAYSWIGIQNVDDELGESADVLDDHTQRLSVLVLSLDRSLTEPIPWADIEEQANQVLRVADNCLQRLEELEKLEERKKEQKEKSPDSNTKQVYRNTRWHIRDFMAKVYDLCDFSHSLQAQLTNLPGLLLCGEAGQGKTHLFCDIARRRIDAGFPTILLMGQQFTQAEPWTQIVHQLGLPETSRNDLLGALQAAAQARNARALLMIDALNEGEGKRIWFSYLPAMLQALFSYPWISVALSVRSSYEHVVIPGELVDKKLVRAEHYGFAEHEYQATRTFFDYYGIQQPSVPLLVPEFQNPLFLRLLCKGLHETHQSKLPAGLHGITSIFRLFVNAIDEKLWREMYYKHYPKPRFLVWSAINRLAEAMANSSQDWVAVEEAEAIVNQLGPAHEQSLYRILIDEGILAENDRYSGQDDWIEVSQFAYERFSDHFIARYLLDKHLNAQEPSQAFLSGQPLAFLTEKRQRYSGLLAALSIQLPERIGKELPDIVPMIADSREVAQAFIQSIVWRDPKAITDHTLRYLDRYANHSFGARDQILDAILTVAANPQHPYNADFLHTRLVKVEMAERDAWWSTFLHRQYGAHGAVDRLVDWAWSPGDKSHIDDESVRLCGVTLAWFLTTSNRFLRDRATKALVNLLTCRIHVLIEVLEQFRDVNDPYVSERLYAVAYGCALRSTDDVQIGMLAQAVYDRVFRDGKPPTHILLRDYARGVVEYGLYRGTKLDVEPNKIRPPYETDWLTNVPEPNVIEEYGKWSEEMPDQEWSRVAIHSSVMAHGDFCRNVLEDAVNNWTSLRLDEPRWLSFEEKVQEFVSSLTTLQRDKWRVYQEARQRSQESWRSIQSILVELSDEELQTIIESASDRGNPVGIQNDDDESANEAPDADEFEIQTAKRDFSRTLGKKKLEVFEKQIAPFLNGSLSSDFPPSFDLTLAQRWIVQQVFEMGWTLERFGRFDRQLDRRQNLEEVHKAESIGEKYQWIAYHEFLARLADNFQFGDPYSSHPQSHCYDGPWQFHGRDIDPSCVLKTTGRGSNWRRTAKAWWFSNQYDAWDAIVDDVEWMNATLDLPDVQSFIEVIKPDDRSKWLALDGFYHWEQPAPPEEERYEKVRREMQYVLHGYLVHRADCSELFRWTAQQDFESLRMPKNQSIYRMYLGEFYWSPAYRYFTDPYEGYAGWCGGEPDSRIPKPILPLVETYAQENSGFDCSIDDNISIIVPAQFIVERMGLESRGMDGKYYDDTGTLIAFDPSVDENGPQTLLVLKDTFLSFLKENEFCIIWTVLGEKQLIGGGLRHDNWKGRLEISGACCMKEGRFESTINPRFHSPQDRVQL